MLLGGDGQVGQVIRSCTLPEDWHLDSYNKDRLDITNHSAVRVAIDNASPDIIVNLAALSSVDAAEKDKGLAVSVNFDAPANLAAICSFRDIPLIHLSTDYIFDGEKEAPYSPEDTPSPINAYGQSKMFGEDAVRQELAWHVILRTSWVFSEFGNNMLIKTLNRAKEEGALRVASDQIGSPTYGFDLAHAIVTIIDKLLAGKSDGFGTFHYCGTPCATRYEFAEEAIRASSIKSDLTAAQAGDFPDFVARPHYSVMDCSKILKIYGIEQRSWRDGITKAILALVNQGKLAIP